MSDRLEEGERLLDDAQYANPDQPAMTPGSTWAIDNKGRSPGARLFTGRMTFWCCFHTGVEMIELPDSTLVQIERTIQPGSAVVQVVVISCPVKRSYENESGSIQTRWLLSTSKNNRKNSKQLSHQKYTVKESGKEPTAQLFKNLANDERRGSLDVKRTPSIQRAGIKRISTRNSSMFTSPRTSPKDTYDTLDKRNAPYSGTFKERINLGAELPSDKTITHLVRDPEVQNDISDNIPDNASYYSDSSLARSTSTVGSNASNSSGIGNSAKKKGVTLKSSRSNMKDMKQSLSTLSEVAESKISIAASEKYLGDIAQLESDTKKAIEKSRKRLEDSKNMVENDNIDEAATSFQPVTTPKYELASGNLSVLDISNYFAVIKHFRTSYREIFAMFSDGKVRSITGDVLRQAIKKLQLISNLENVGAVSIPTVSAQVLSLLDFFPLDQLVEIKVIGDHMSVSFDFGDSIKQKIKIPGIMRIVIANEEDDNSLLVSGNGTLKLVKSEPLKFFLSNELNFKIGENGIVSCNEGELIQRGIIDVNTSIRMEHVPHRMDRDIKDRPVLWMMNNGKPASKNGKYSARYGDDWIVFKNIRGENWVMLPDLSSIYR